MYYNNLLSIPILLFASLTTEDWSAKNIAQNFPEDTKYAVIASMIISGMSAVGISYTSAWCVRVTSSTTYSMVGALNKLPIALSGLLFFKAPINFYSISSIFIGFAAGLVYAIAKQKQNWNGEKVVVIHGVKVFEVGQLYSLSHEQHKCGRGETVGEHPEIANVKIEFTSVNIRITIRSHCRGEHHQYKRAQSQVGHTASEPDDFTISNKDNGQVFEYRVNWNAQIL